jgi:transglutaminase-like putative cysteine protease
MATRREPLPPPPPGYYYDYEDEPEPRPRRRRRSPLRGVIAALIVLLLLFIILFFTPVGDMLFSGFGNNYPAYSEFTLTRTFDISVSGGTIDYELDIPLPQDITTTSGYIQDLQSISRTPTGTDIAKYGSDWVEWSSTTSQATSVSITYQMRVNTQIWDVTGSESGLQTDIPDNIVDMQTGNEWDIKDDEGNSTGRWKIWPTNPQIISLAESLTSPYATVVENVESIYQYIDQEITYLTIRGQEPKECLETLADGTGDCDDQSILFCSLCRAVGIPAWLAFGGLYDPTTGTWGGHAWAEVYIPLAEGGGGSVVIDLANSEFMVRNCNRYEEWKSNGNSDALQDYYYLFTHYTTSPLTHANVVESYSGVYTASSDRVSSRSLDLNWVESLMLGESQYDK